MTFNLGFGWCFAYHRGTVVPSVILDGGPSSHVADTLKSNLFEALDPFPVHVHRVAIVARRWRIRRATPFLPEFD